MILSTLNPFKHTKRIPFPFPVTVYQICWKQLNNLDVSLEYNYYKMKWSHPDYWSIGREGPWTYLNQPALSTIQSETFPTAHSITSSTYSTAISFIVLNNSLLTATWESHFDGSICITFCDVYVFQMLGCCAFWFWFNFGNL